MEKLNLKKFGLDSSVIMDRSQLRNTMGGGSNITGCDWTCDCPDGFILAVGIPCDGTCAAMDNQGAYCTTSSGNHVEFKCLDMLDMCPGGPY